MTRPDTILDLTRPGRAGIDFRAGQLGSRSGDAARPERRFDGSSTGIARRGARAGRESGPIARIDDGRERIIGARRPGARRFAISPETTPTT